MAITIDSLVIEVTRQCWLACDHCLRGDAQDVVFDVSIAEQFFSQMPLGHIIDLTFSGGEPLMHMEIIDKVADILKKYRITIDHFYIATSCPPGFKISDLGTFLKLLEISESPETCSIQLSDDMFHMEYNPDTLFILEMLKATSKRNEGYKNVKMKVIPAGRALYSPGLSIDTDDYRNRISVFIDDKGNNSFSIENVVLYLNCKREIILGCDWSYEEQETEMIAIPMKDDFELTKLPDMIANLIKERIENGYQND